MNTLQQEPITVIISRRVKPEDTEAFEALSAEMTHRASQFKGYLSTAMFRPAGPDDPEIRAARALLAPVPGGIADRLCWSCWIRRR